LHFYFRFSDQNHSLNLISSSAIQYHTSHTSETSTKAHGSTVTKEHQQRMQTYTRFTNVGTSMYIVS